MLVFYKVTYHAFSSEEEGVELNERTKGAGFIVLCNRVRVLRERVGECETVQDM